MWPWHLTASLSASVLLVFGAPVPNYPPKEMVGFMKSFGYLQDIIVDGSPAETLYTEEGFREVIKQVQRFGGLNETGILDAETLALMDKPRCGVPDILHDEHQSQHNRTKRYIIATPGWTKRRLTYYLSNWAASLDSRDAWKRLKEAFSLWSEIAPLRFSPSNSPDADLLVSFQRGDHGDGYSFDGPGNTLAHAFFPSQHGSQGGDIHFDGDEEWVDNNGRDKGKHGGVDFLTVATHEIGHSLGLAHSTSPNSIMFPYYKGHTEHLKLGYDDVLAMYDLYVRQGMFEDGPLEEESDRERNRQPENPRPPSKPDEDDRSNGDERRTNMPVTPRYPYPRDDGDVNRPTRNPAKDKPSTTVSPRYPEKRPTQQPKPDRPHHRPTTKEPNRPDKPTKRPTMEDDSSRRYPNRTPERPPGPREKDKESTDNRTKIPDICAGKMDAAALLRNELFFFKGQFMWRFRDRGMPFNGYPIEYHHFFRGLPKSVKHIDAVYQRATDHKIVIFSGRKVWVYTGDRFTPESPMSLSSFGLPPYVDSLDAAFVWSKNEKTYFFKGDEYWRYDEHSKTIDDGYPMKIHTRWIGVPDRVDTALTFNDGQTYFFKDHLYWRFDNIGVKIDVNFPRSTAEDWIGC